jgi:predicted SAM-dependent methyltransferase
MAAEAPSKKIMIGAGSKQEPGWLTTQIEYLDLLKPADWDRFFKPDTLDAMLAEHVWEHLTPEQGLVAAETCFKYLKPGGYVRIAVPDGLHPDPEYIQWVKVGGASPMQIANDHKVLYTYRDLSALFERAGFEVVLYEYFDEAGAFHYREWDPKDGKIWRSKRFDKRNRDGRLVFTSIILDAVKRAVPAAERTRLRA